MGKYLEKLAVLKVATEEFYNNSNNKRIFNYSQVYTDNTYF
jgi:hypothetical protein